MARKTRHGRRYRKLMLADPREQLALPITALGGAGRGCGPRETCLEIGESAEGFRVTCHRLRAGEYAVSAPPTVCISCSRGWCAALVGSSGVGIGEHQHAGPGLPIAVSPDIWTCGKLPGVYGVECKAMLQVPDNGAKRHRVHMPFVLR